MTEAGSLCGPPPLRRGCSALGVDGGQNVPTATRNPNGLEAITCALSDKQDTRARPGEREGQTKGYHRTERTETFRMHSRAAPRARRGQRCGGGCFARNILGQRRRVERRPWLGWALCYLFGQDPGTAAGVSSVLTCSVAICS